MNEQQEHSEILTLTYESTAQRADAKAVGAGILTIQSMIEEVQNAFDENQRILVKARPFSDGSLNVPLELIAFGAAIILQEYPLLQKIREVIAQYFDIKKRLRGQPIQIEDGNLVIIENSRVHVDQITLKCLDPRSVVSKKCSNAFHNIEEDPEIKGVRVSTNISTDPLAHILRREFRHFHPETSIEIQNLGQKLEKSRERLIIRQPAFDLELAWRFIWREMKISAKVEHEDFLKKVQEGQESFAAGDSLEVDLQRLQEYDPSALTFTDKQYTITRVWQHYRRPRQQQGELFE